MNTNQIVNIRGTGIALMSNDIDTDRIIPARFLKELTFAHLGHSVFADDRRHTDEMGGVHPFSDVARRQARILAVAKNFGCGSSREHAPQALKRWGIDAVIGESFGEIFRGNCASIGLPCLTVSEMDANALREYVFKEPAGVVEVDLSSKEIRFGRQCIGFALSDAICERLISGKWDILIELVEQAGAIKQVAMQLPYVQSFQG